MVSRRARQAAAAGSSPLQWSDANTLAAYNKGWGLVTGSPHLKRWLTIRYPQSLFADKAELHGFLVQRALDGAALEIKALAILYAGNKEEFLAVMKGAPANQTGKLVKNVITFARVAGAIIGE